MKGTIEGRGEPSSAGTPGTCVLAKWGNEERMRTDEIRLDHVSWEAEAAADCRLEAVEGWATRIDSWRRLIPGLRPAQVADLFDQQPRCAADGAGGMLADELLHPQHRERVSIACDAARGF